MSVFKRRKKMHNPFNQVKAYLFMSFLIIMGLIIVTSCTPAYSQSNVSIQDHYKNVIMQLPKRVEVCYDKTVSGDKTGDALMGAIIGGIIGNNVTKNLPDGGTAGAIIGGMLGHQNSDAKGGTQRVCREETRYTESQERVYSHSTISFLYNGKIHKVRFQK